MTTYTPRKGDITLCPTCGNDKCSGCEELLRHKEFLHIFYGEDVCEKCQGSKEEVVF